MWDFFSIIAATYGLEYLENASKKTCQLFTTITSQRVTTAA